MSFFDGNYRTPRWYQKKINRRQMLKSAAGATAIAAMPTTFAVNTSVTDKIAADPWQTLDAVHNHLLPSSTSGPGAVEIQATQYLFNVINLQPIEDAERTFIFKGVGWLNGYSDSLHKKRFVELSLPEKEAVLKAVSRSRAGHNWINTLLGYIYEAMLAPPAYGGNPDGVGWSWLDHKAGFPLPKEGARYYELPGTRYSDKKIPIKNIVSDTITTEEKRKS